MKNFISQENFLNYNNLNNNNGNNFINNNNAFKNCGNNIIENNMNQINNNQQLINNNHQQDNSKDIIYEETPSSNNNILNLNLNNFKAIISINHQVSFSIINKNFIYTENLKKYQINIQNSNIPEYVEKKRKYFIKDELNKIKKKKKKLEFYNKFEYSIKYYLL